MESTSSNRDSNPIVPKNMRDQVVLELLSTERKYVLDLETLQVSKKIKNKNNQKNNQKNK